MKNKYVELAEHLFELELERLCNDKEFYFEFNGWYSRFGSKSINHADKLMANPNDVKRLSLLIKDDFKNGEWDNAFAVWKKSKDKDSGLYNYMMPDHYGGFITSCLERQIALLSGVGYQAEICFS